MGLPALVAEVELSSFFSVPPHYVQDSAKLWTWEGRASEERLPEGPDLLTSSVAGLCLSTGSQDKEGDRLALAAEKALK